MVSGSAYPPGYEPPTIEESLKNQFGCKTVHYLSSGDLSEEGAYLITNCKADPYDKNKKPCKHAIKVTSSGWTVPNVVVAFNEGGFNSTAVCADCVAELIKPRKKNAKT